MPVFSQRVGNKPKRLVGGRLRNAVAIGSISARSVPPMPRPRITSTTDRSRSVSESKPAMPISSRSIRRLTKLADAAVIKTGEERDLIVKTILKILDECSDAEYDAACAS